MTPIRIDFLLLISLLCRGADDSHGKGRNLGATNQEQPTSIISSLGQQSDKMLKPPKLNINTCHATIPLGA